MSLEWYNVFYVTAKAQNFSKASQELFITQPAVSHSIKQLEEKLGVALFFRGSKGVRLTSEGEALFQYIEQAFALVQIGESKIDEMKNMESGEIRIGAGDTICKHFLLPFIRTFHELYPHIHLQVTNRTSLETLELLRQHKIDFGFVHSPVQDNQFHYRESIRIQDCFVAGEAYRDLAGKPLSVAELASHPLLLLEHHSASRRYIDDFAKTQGTSLKPSIELGSFDLLVQFAQIGLGISCVVHNYVEAELEQGKLFEITLTESIPPRSIYIVYAKNLPLSAAAKRFLDGLP